MEYTQHSMCITTAYVHNDRAKDGGEQQRAAARIAQLRALQVEEAVRKLRTDDDLDVKERVKTVLDQMRGEGGTGGAMSTSGGAGGRRPGPRSVGPVGPGGLRVELREGEPGGMPREVVTFMDALAPAEAASPSEDYEEEEDEDEEP